MPKYSNVEYTEMLIHYGMAGYNGRVAARLYAARWPNRPCPDHRAFDRVYARGCETGDLKPNRRGAGRPRTTR